METTKVNFINQPTSTVPYETINYYQVIEKSQYFTDLEQILNWLKIAKDFDYYPFLREHLIIGIENTIKNGYKLKL